MDGDAFMSTSCDVTFTGVSVLLLISEVTLVSGDISGGSTDKLVPKLPQKEEFRVLVHGPSRPLTKLIESLSLVSRGKGCKPFLIEKLYELVTNPGTEDDLQVLDDC